MILQKIKAQKSLFIKKKQPLWWPEFQDVNYLIDFFKFFFQRAPQTKSSNLLIVSLMKQSKHFYLGKIS